MLLLPLKIMSAIVNMRENTDGLVRGTSTSDPEVIGSNPSRAPMDCFYSSNLCTEC